MTGPRILVVEDDPRLAATLERVLQAEGYDVEVAGDGLEALRRARERVFDLVVLDVMLPGMDGIAVCRRLRAGGSISILLLTALGSTDERVRGLDSGADDYLAKPFAYEELLARVRALLRRAVPNEHLKFGPDPGGPLTAWHEHQDICFTPFGFEFSLMTPTATCPIGSVDISVPPMLHVWIVPNPRGGPFAVDIDDRVVRAIDNE